MVDGTKTTVIAGVGEGLGSGWRSASRGRLRGRDVGAQRGQAARISRERSRRTAAGPSGIQADARDEKGMVGVLERIENEVGPIEVAIYNAGRAASANRSWRSPAMRSRRSGRLGCSGGFVFGREAIRHMLPRGRGTLLFTGATSSLRGGQNFAAFAAAKFGLRAVAQSMAREFGPRASTSPPSSSTVRSTCRRSTG